MGKSGVLFKDWYLLHQYIVWKERNNRIFMKVEGTVQMVVTQIVNIVKLKLLKFGYKRFYRGAKNESNMGFE